MNNVIYILYTVYSSVAQMYRLVYYLLYLLFIVCTVRCVLCTLYLHKTELVGVDKIGLCYDGYCKKSGRAIKVEPGQQRIGAGQCLSRVTKAGTRCRSGSNSN